MAKTSYLIGFSHRIAVYPHQFRVSADKEFQTGVKRRPVGDIGDFDDQVKNIAKGDIRSVRIGQKAQKHVQFGRPKDLYCRAGRSTHRDRCGQAFAADKPGKINVDVIDADCISTDNKLADAGLAGANLADMNRIDGSLQVDIRYIASRCGSHGGQAGRHMDTGGHVAQVETFGHIPQSNGNLEEFFQCLDATVDNNDPWDGPAVFIGNHHDLGRIFQSAAKTSAAAHEKPATAETIAHRSGHGA